MEVRDRLKRASDNGTKPVKPIVFEGERFDVMSVRRWRERVLQVARRNNQDLQDFVHAKRRARIEPSSILLILSGLGCVRRVGASFRSFRAGCVFSSSEPRAALRLPWADSPLAFQAHHREPLRQIAPVFVAAACLVGFERIAERCPHFMRHSRARQFCQNPPVKRRESKCVWAGRQ
jgi:hypothetical protein